jgi:hypothetical protein
MDIPEACTLPTLSRPLRLAELEAMFTTSLGPGERLGPTRARFPLTGSASLVRELTAREAECCSFFTFTVTSASLELEVPPAHADVLAALLAR